MKWIVIVAMMFSFSFVTTEAQAKAKGRGPASETQSTLSDTVKKVREDDEGIVILFTKNAGSYYLRRDVTGFDSSKKKLEESLKSKKPVSVTVEPAQLNILEVK